MTWPCSRTRTEVCPNPRHRARTDPRLLRRTALRLSTRRSISPDLDHSHTPLPSLWIDMGEISLRRWCTATGWMIESRSFHPRKNSSRSSGTLVERWSILRWGHSTTSMCRLRTVDLVGLMVEREGVAVNGPTGQEQD